MGFDPERKFWVDDRVYAHMSLAESGTDAEREWWGGMWAERAVKSDFARMAVEGGFATAEDLERIAQGWLSWAADEDGWLCLPHGEILCRV